MSRSDATTPTSPFLILLLMLGLLSMLAAAAHDVIHGDAAAHVVKAAAKADAAPPIMDETAAPAFTQEQSDDMMTLMQQLQANPNDTEALLAIGQAFFGIQDWTRAGIFFARAVTAAPDDIRPRLWLGNCLYQQGEMEKAAQCFEDLLAVKKSYETMFNLAIIYKYHLNKPEQAKRLLQEIVSSPAPEAGPVAPRAAKEL